METKILVEEGKELEGPKKGLAYMATVIFSFVASVVVCFYFFWEMSTVGATILLVAILWFRWDEVKKKAPPYLGVFLKRSVGIVLFGLFLGVAMAAVTTTWIRYLVAFVFFAIALGLYKSYKR